MRNRTKSWISYIAVTVAGALLAILIASQWFNRYVGKVIIESNELLADGQRIFYSDVDNDGDSEEFIYYHLSDNQQPVINQYSNNGKFQNVWYLKGEVVYHFDFIEGDYNQDGLKEIYVFSNLNDTLYLYGLMPHQSNQFVVEKQAVCKLPQKTAASDIVIHPGGLADMNGDGFKEVLFSVNSRYAPTPRNVFLFDIENSNLSTSPDIGMQIVGRPIVYDINNDGSPEVFISTLNSTTQGWLPSVNSTNYSASIVLTSALNYLYVPLIYNNRMSVTQTVPFVTNQKHYIAALSWPLNKNGIPVITLMNVKGDIIRQKNLSPQRFVFDPKRENWNELLFFNHNGCGYRFNELLEIYDSLHCKNLINQIAFLPVDKDAMEELIVVEDNYLTLYQQGLKHPVKLNMPGLGVRKVYFSVKKNKNGPNHLSIQNHNYHHLAAYSQHPHFWIKYLVYFAIIILTHLLYFLGKRFYHIHFRQKGMSEEESLGLKVDFMKNQVDPHFLFNALNSIAFSINKDDRKTAYANLTVFSKLMRESIAAIDDFSRPLEEEINYVKNYFILEKFRFKERFNYDFIVSPEVRKSMIVPKMVIFCFAESALKKGILPHQDAGRIEIVVDVIPGQATVIHIKDNGVVRTVDPLHQPASKNIQLLNKLVSYYNSFNENKITIHCQPNPLKSSAKGCHVEIVLPYEYSYTQSEWD